MLRLLIFRPIGADNFVIQLAGKAYRQIPVHPDDRWLLGMRWNGNLFCDATLPFGLRSAPMFSAVADALEWMVKARGASHVFHYVDDFVIVGRPGSSKCGDDLGLLMQTCADLGVIVAEDKTEGPSTCLTILGIVFDSLAMELRLPQEKLCRHHDALTQWQGRHSSKWKDLESVVGLLQHASQVVRPAEYSCGACKTFLCKQNPSNHIIPCNLTLRLKQT